MFFTQPKVYAAFLSFTHLLVIPHKTFLKSGVKVGISIPCTDGIYTLNTNLVREYGIAAKTFDLGVKEILAIARYSIRHSFAPAEVKAQGERQWEVFASFYLKDMKFAGPDREAKLTADDAFTDDRFGSSVAIDGDVIVVGGL